MSQSTDKIQRIIEQNMDFWTVLGIVHQGTFDYSLLDNFFLFAMWLLNFISLFYHPCKFCLHGFMCWDLLFFTCFDIYDVSKIIPVLY
jgi:hypothetical protein